MFFDPQISDPASALDKAKAGIFGALAVIGVLVLIVSWFLA